MKNIILLLTLVTMVVISCNSPEKEEIKVDLSQNPFLMEYDAPFGVPPFDKIKVEHYMPAFEEGIKQHEAEIVAIVANTEEPTFENTVYAMDKAGHLLENVGAVFFNVNETDTDEQMQEVARQITPLLTKHKDNVSMNLDLFKKVKVVYEKRNESKLDSSQIRVVEKYFKNFERNGANLNAEDQNKLKKLNEEIANLILKYGENLLAETNTNFQLIIEKKDDLAGLPKGVIDAAASTAKEMKQEGKWIFTLGKPSLLPFLQYSEKRELREKIYRGYFMRGNNDNEFDNKELAVKLATLRADKVKLLGFETHAAYVIDVNMAKTPENVFEFINKLWEPALNNAKNEVKEMQAIIDRDGGDFKLASWDWWYYADKLKKEKYDLDESVLSEYFVAENVREGMFWTAKQLYGITFEKLNNIPVYNEEVEVYEAKEADGTHIGLLFLDLFPRASKGPGAWCTSFREAGYDNNDRVYPLSAISCSFTKPTADTPSLLTWDEVTTMFHEFGHALHGLFTDGKYSKTAGVVPRDYVELPSQIMENFAGEPVVLKQYAKHYKTGEIIPDELIEKIKKSGKFNQGFATVEYLAASLLDLEWHSLKSGDVVEDALAFETKIMEKYGLIEEIIPRYRSTYFAHIFNGGYSAGYYVYMWAAVLDADAFNAFKESGDLFNQDLAAKFRKYCLSEVGEDEGMVQYNKFRGQEPSVEPLLIRRGLK